MTTEYKNEIQKLIWIFLDHKSIDIAEVSEVKKLFLMFLKCEVIADSSCLAN